MSKEPTVTLRMPESALSLLRETLEMDAKSRAFTIGLREQIAKALEQVVEANPQIIIHVEEGLVQGVISDTPLNYIVADCDVEGADKDDTIHTPLVFRKAIGGAHQIHSPLHNFQADVSVEAVEELKGKL